MQTYAANSQLRYVRPGDKFIACDVFNNKAWGELKTARNSHATGRNYWRVDHVEGGTTNLYQSTPVHIERLP